MSDLNSILGALQRDLGRLEGKVDSIGETTEDLRTTVDSLKRDRAWLHGAAAAGGVICAFFVRGLWGLIFSHKS